LQLPGIYNVQCSEIYNETIYIVSILYDRTGHARHAQCLGASNQRNDAKRFAARGDRSRRTGVGSEADG
jgi:hypothetical protein